MNILLMVIIIVLLLVWMRNYIRINNLKRRNKSLVRKAKDNNSHRKAYEILYKGKMRKSL